MLEIEILEKRKEVLHYLQELRESGESYARFSYLYFKRDRHSEGYWQRVLQELNEVILQHEGCSQCGTHIRYDDPLCNRFLPTRLRLTTQLRPNWVVGNAGFVEASDSYLGTMRMRYMIWTVPIWSCRTTIGLHCMNVLW